MGEFGWFAIIVFFFLLSKVFKSFFYFICAFIAIVINPIFLLTVV